LLELVDCLATTSNFTSFDVTRQLNCCLDLIIKRHAEIYNIPATLAIGYVVCLLIIQLELSLL